MTSRALVETCLERIAALDSVVHAWTVVDGAGALATADRLDAEAGNGWLRGPLHGVPVGIKDIFHVAGLRTRAGTRGIVDVVPEVDAVSVARLRAAGAVILGKLHTTEFAYADPAPTVNPWNPSRTPGGSSSGSAAAVAARMVPLALGTQTVGSTIRPAAFCGTVGLKPSYGAISRRGVIAAAWSLDHVGIFARSVDDAALAWSVLADGPVGPAPGAPGADPGAWERSNGVSRPPRLGIVREPFWALATRDTQEHVEQVGQRLAEAGATLDLVPPVPILAAFMSAIQVLIRAEAAARHADLYREHADRYRPQMRAALEAGMCIPAEAYLRAQRLRRHARRELTPLLAAFDALLMPAAPGVAPGLSTTGDPSFNAPWSGIGAPQIAMPIGLAHGLPLGIQLIGAPGTEARLIDTARFVESVVGFAESPADPILLDQDEPLPNPLTQTDKETAMSTPPRPEPGLTRRSLLQLGGGLIGTSALAGAVGGLATPRRAGAADDTGPLAKAGLAPMGATDGPPPKRGGTIRGARTGDFNHFDPFYTGAVQRPMHHNLYSSLFYYDKDLNVLPGLAERYEVSADRLTLKVYLRKGVKFHNGRELTADDVVFNVERAMDKSIGHSAFAQTMTMQGAKTLDRYTAVIGYKQPTAYLFDTFCFMGIVAKESVGDIKRTAVGTGPFKLDRWVPGDHARLVRNEAYWEAGLPYADEVMVRSFKDLPTMLVNLESGELDLVEGMPLNELDRLRKTKNLGVYSGVPGFFYNVYVSTKVKPLDNRKVRQALSLAIDRKTIVNKVLYGFSEVAQTPFPKTSWAYDAQLDNTYPFDLDRARKLLTEAGVGRGFETTVVSTPAFPELTDMALIMQADYAKIGVKLKIEEVATAQLYPRLFAGNFEMMMSFSGRAHKDPGSVWLIQPAYKPGGNMLGWQSDAYEQLLAQGAATFERDKRKAIYHKVQQILLDEAFELIVARRFTAFGARTDRLHDFRFGLDEDWYLHRAWVS